jgi:hypothetical protein
VSSGWRPRRPHRRGRGRFARRGEAHHHHAEEDQGGQDGKGCEGDARRRPRPQDAVRESRPGGDRELAFEEGKPDLRRKGAKIGLFIEQAELDQRLVRRAADPARGRRGPAQDRLRHAVMKEKSDLDRQRGGIARRSLERLTLNGQKR